MLVSVYQMCLNEEGLLLFLCFLKLFFVALAWLEQFCCGCMEGSSGVPTCLRLKPRFCLSLSSAQVSLETSVQGEQHFLLGCTNTTQIFGASLHFMRYLDRLNGTTESP